MADATFNGNTLTITLTAGGALHSVDVQKDLYSAWKRWMTTSYQNQGYPPAFRTIGGDTLDATSGLSAGKYYFLQNQYGWRIKPEEEDSNITFVGNLIAEDSTQDLLTPTTGAFTVIINGLQPITQFAESTPGSLTAAQVWAYQGSSAVDKEDDLIKARKAAEAARNLSA